MSNLTVLDFSLSCLSNKAIKIIDENKKKRKMNSSILIYYNLINSLILYKYRDKYILYLNKGQLNEGHINYDCYRIINYLLFICYYFGLKSNKEKTRYSVI